ncbi:MAG: response regulator [Candidatus Moranbacteria bacterium]|nr:response regulator [Candidatus Moranbacteria bacterium]
MKDNKPTVLIVDDHEMIRENYADVFADNGFEVLSANDGVEALEKVDKNEVDLVFTGIIMPRMDGFQLLENLKMHTTTSGLPVLINSHLGREEDKEKMMELGADDFIVHGTVQPIEVVKKARWMLTPNKYLLRICKDELDFKQFKKDKQLSEDLKCQHCGGELALELKEKKDEYAAKVICPECKSYH